MFSDTKIELNPDHRILSQRPDQGQLPVLMHLDSLRWTYPLPFAEGTEAKLTTCFTHVILSNTLV